MKPEALSATWTGNEIAGLSSHGKVPSTLHREGPIRRNPEKHEIVSLP